MADVLLHSGITLLDAWRAARDAGMHLIQTAAGDVVVSPIIPPGAREANITVKVRIMLAEDGSVSGQPEIMNGPGDYLFSTTAQSTVTAILGCQNYDFLPKEQYDVWKDLVLNFNPNMFAEAATQ
jgi:hypothetical protein